MVQPMMVDGTTVANTSPNAFHGVRASYTAQPGDTVENIAARHDVPPPALAEANNLAHYGNSPGANHGLTEYQAVTPGRELVIPEAPADAPQTPATTQTPQQRTDAAAEAYQDAVQQHAPPNEIDAARTEFKDAVQSEINGSVADSRRGVPARYQTPASELIDNYSSDIAARYQGQTDLDGIVNEAAGELKVLHKADSLIPGYYGSFTAAEKLQGIPLEGQPQAVIDAVLDDPRVQGWLAEAAADVGKPLQGVSDEDLPTAAEEVGNAAQLLAEATADMDPALAAELARQSLPTIEKMAELNPRFGDMPFQSLSAVVDAMQGAPTADSVTSEIASIIKPESDEELAALTGPGANNVITSTIANGHSATLAIEMARAMKADGSDQANRVLSAVIEGIPQLQRNAETHMQEYVGLTEELSWLISNGGDAMTADQLQEAVADYKADKGTEWANKVEDAKAQLVNDGRVLAQTIAQLQDLPAELRNESTPRMLDMLDSRVDDSETTQQILNFAVTQDPTIMQGEQGKAILDFYSGVSLGDSGRKLTGTLVQNYVSQTVLSQVQNVDPNNPQSIHDAHAALERLRTQWTSGNWGNALGISETQLNNAIDAVDDSLPRAGDSVSSVTQRLQHLDDTLAGIDGFSAQTAAGRAFRGLGFAASSVGLINSLTHPPQNPQQMIGGLASAVGLAQDASSFAASFNLLDADGSLARWGSGLSNAGKLTSKVLGWTGAALSADAAVRSFAKGDVPAGLLNTAAVGGGAIAVIFANTAWGGPVGLAIGAASAVGLGWYNHVQEANKFQTETTTQFLQHAGFDQEAAEVLTDQSGEGYSTLPLLAEYAEAKGYDMDNPAERQQFVDWVNSIPSEKLSHARDWMHHTLDDFDGDVSKLDTQNQNPVWPKEFVAGMGGGAYVHSTPHSVGALDGMMQEYGIDPLDNMA